MQVDRWYTGAAIVYPLLVLMDIVYLLKDAPIIDELTLSLRSLRHLQHDKVFFIGGFPGNIDPEKVYHIPTEQGVNKYKNTTHALQIACQSQEISKDFILMNDDFFLLSDIKDPKKELNLHRGYVEDVIKEYKEHSQGVHTPYIECMEQTSILLRSLGYVTPLSYELHIPMCLSKSNLKSMFTLNGLDCFPLLQPRTIYGNLYLSGSQYTKDVKMDYFHPGLPDSTKFLSTSDERFKKLKPFLLGMFPDKSEYEL